MGARRKRGKEPNRESGGVVRNRRTRGRVVASSQAVRRSDGGQQSRRTRVARCRRMRWCVVSWRSVRRRPRRLPGRTRCRAAARGVCVSARPGHDGSEPCGARGATLCLSRRGGADTRAICRDGVLLVWSGEANSGACEGFVGQHVLSAHSLPRLRPRHDAGARAGGWMRRLRHRC